MKVLFTQILAVMILPVMSEDGLIQYNELRIHALAKIKVYFAKQIGAFYQ